MLLIAVGVGVAIGGWVTLGCIKIGELWATRQFDKEFTATWGEATRERPSALPAERETTLRADDIAQAEALERYLLRHVMPSRRVH